MRSTDLFVRNSVCLGCLTPLRYLPEHGQLLPIERVEGDAALWRKADGGADAPAWQRCANLASTAACNWLVDPAQNFAGASPHRRIAAVPLCRCCRLTRTLPDLNQPGNPDRWSRIELAKRRLVSSLIGLGLPVQSKMSDDPVHALVFDLPQALPGGPKVMTGHDEGVITLDVEEADDATRELRRGQLREPYRTLLGHLRHESGHCYWDRLVADTAWLAPFREVFGDHSQDYAAALQQHYSSGPRPDWDKQFVSAYASSHPWEDWAETWAHYLHMRDTLDTALSFGVDGERVELHYEQFAPEVLLDAAGMVPADDFLALLNGWMELTGVRNELSRSMGLPDFYPFELAAPSVRKLYFVHRVVSGAAQAVKGMRDGDAAPPV